jgi:hypothetical protein
VGPPGWPGLAPPLRRGRLHCRDPLLRPRPRPSAAAAATLAAGTGGRWSSSTPRPSPACWASCSRLARGAARAPPPLPPPPPAGRAPGLTARSWRWPCHTGHTRSCCCGTCCCGCGRAPPRWRSEGWALGAGRWCCSCWCWRRRSRCAGVHHTQLLVGQCAANFGGPMSMCDHGRALRARPAPGGAPPRATNSAPRPARVANSTYTSHRRSAASPSPCTAHFVRPSCRHAAPDCVRADSSCESTASTVRGAPRAEGGAGGSNCSPNFAAGHPTAHRRHPLGREPHGAVGRGRALPGNCARREAPHGA